MDGACSQVAGEQATQEAPVVVVLEVETAETARTDVRRAHRGSISEICGCRGRLCVCVDGVGEGQGGIEADDIGDIRMRRMRC